MNITKLDNNNNIKIDLNNGCQIYMLQGVFHRAFNPAVVTPFSEDFYYRGVKITKKIARGQLTPQEILHIPNMEIRQRAMEILGYDKFLKIFKKIHEFTPEQFCGKFVPEEMYSLYEHSEKNAKEPIKILQMFDPSKIPFVKYYIRVKPEETDCRLAVAHSYHLSSWEDYIFCKNWV